MKKAIRKICASCRSKFVDPTPGGQRTYCFTCSPPRASRSSRAVKRVRRVSGEPFTLAHFKSWSRRLRLKGDERFVLEPWEELYVADVLAAIRGESSARECWLIVPEGNGKSTLVAVLVLYCVEFAEDAAIPVAASSRDQAEIIFTQGQGFVRRSPALSGRFRCKPGLREIVLASGGGVESGEGASHAKIFASDAGTGDGIIPWPIEVIDELHRHQNLDLYRTWAGKLDKERAILIVISTAGEPGSEFEETRERMRQEAVEVERGPCFGRYVGHESVLHEYAVPEDGDVEDLRLVKAANPSSRITVKTLAAKRARPSWNLGHWRRLTCNLPTRSQFAAVTELEWAGACVLADRDEHLELPAGEHVDAGLDVAWKWDTTALVPLWMPRPDLRLFGPAAILEPPRDGSSLDPHLVEQALVTLHERNPIDTLVMDTSKAEQLASWIEEELGSRVIDRQQTNVLACLDYNRFMEALREGWLRHTGDPGLTRHVLNAVARTFPGGDSRFDRPAQNRRSALQDRRVIDALTAASMVHGFIVAGLDEPPPPPPLVAYV